MTDEEKAEEYVSPKIWGDTYYVNCCGDWSNEEMKQAYLDGLAEGRKEKWHDLRKDPNDLPGHSHSVIVAYKNSSGCLFTDQGYLGAMNIWNVQGISPHEVIAWCELPKFEE